MGIFSNLGGLRAQEGLPTSTSTSVSNKKKWSWSNLMPFVLALVVIAEIAFLGRLDMAKNTALFGSWPEMFLTSHSSGRVEVADVENIGIEALNVDHNSVTESCHEWLEREDAVVYSRDFDKDPIWVFGPQQEWKTCDVSCSFRMDRSKKPDAVLDLTLRSGVASVLRSMESALYYPDNNIALARRKGYDIVMTTSLSSDVPVGYFSWAEYDIMTLVMPKTEKAIAAAFISNCGAHNFRLEALDALESANITIDSYGACHKNRKGRGDKVEALKRYKFSLAFENSNEEDYVTEKFFQSLVAGGSMKVHLILSKLLLIWLRFIRHAVCAFTWRLSSGRKRRRALTSRNAPASVPEGQKLCIIYL
ncbi:hypothetical protein PTKIN_Ptkin02bG0181200 [Pterospermum kingtungense]